MNMELSIFCGFTKFETYICIWYKIIEKNLASTQNLLHTMEI